MSIGELKYHDVDVDDATVDAGMNVQNALLTIPEGLGEEQRVGRRITLRKIAMRWDCLLPTTVTAANTADILRLMIVHDKQCNGALPANTDVLETNDYQSFNNLSNSMRFRTLYDETFEINCGAGSGQGTTAALSYADATIQGTVFRDVNIPIEYDNSAADGSIGTVRSNNIVVLVGCKTGALTFNSKMRFRYTDK